MYFERKEIIKKTPHKKWKKYLIDFYGHDKGGLVFFKSMYEYHICILNFNKQVNNYLNNKIKYYILPIISLYKGFVIAGFSRKESIDNVEKILKLQYDENKILYKILSRFGNMYFNIVLKKNKKQYKNLGSRRCKIDSSNIADKNVKEIFYSLILYQFHSEDLLELICRNDKRIFKKVFNLKLSNKVSYKKTSKFRL